MAAARYKSRFHQEETFQDNVWLLSLIVNAQHQFVSEKEKSPDIVCVIEGCKNPQVRFAYVCYFTLHHHQLAIHASEEQRDHQRKKFPPNLLLESYSIFPHDAKRLMETITQLKFKKNETEAPFKTAELFTSSKPPSQPELNQLAYSAFKQLLQSIILSDLPDAYAEWVNSINTKAVSPKSTLQLK